MSYENNGQNVNYEINEFGEITRKDYAFRSAKKSPNQPLPTNRSVWMVYLLSFITLGIYGIVLGFNMAGETNITCEEDGKRTPGFWKTLLLSVITFGIYGIVWYYKWCDREANYLENHNEAAFLTGREWLSSQAWILLLRAVPAFGFSILSGYPYFISEYHDVVSVLLWCDKVLNLVVLGIALRVLGSILAQHNAVNKLYNLRRFPSKG